MTDSGRLDVDADNGRVQDYLEDWREKYIGDLPGDRADRDDKTVEVMIELLQETYGMSESESSVGGESEPMDAGSAMEHGAGGGDPDEGWD